MLPRQYGAKPFVWELCVVTLSVTARRARNCGCRLSRSDLEKSCSATATKNSNLPSRSISAQLCRLVICLCRLGKNESAWAGKGGSAVCVRAQEGSVKSLRCSFVRLTRLPPETTAIKPVVGCQSPLVVFFPDLITEGELNHSALTRDGGGERGGGALCRAVQQGLLFDLGGKRFSSARNVFSDPRT